MEKNSKVITENLMLDSRDLRCCYIGVQSIIETLDNLIFSSIKDGDSDLALLNEKVKREKEVTLAKLSILLKYDNCNKKYALAMKRLKEMNDSN